MIEVEQWREGESRVRNDRLVARLSQSSTYAQVKDVSELPPDQVAEWNRFFEHYKNARGQQVSVKGIRSAKHAAEMIGASQR